MTSELQKIDECIAKAQRSIQSTEKLIQELAAENLTSPFSFEEESRALQLLLEYRLNTQDILVELLNLDHHLLYILGIQPQHSMAINIERLAFALGTDDLKVLLHTLNQLVDSLLRIARRYQRMHQEHTTSKTISKKNSAVLDRLKNCVKNQQQLKSLLNLTQTELQRLAKYEALGPVLDHIAALSGPISKFYQAQLNGLEKTTVLWRHFAAHKQFENKLDDLLNKADLALKAMPSLYHPSPNYQLGQFPNKTEQLEQKASAKRLRPFF